MKRPWCDTLHRRLSQGYLITQNTGTPQQHPMSTLFCATRTATKRKDAFMQASSHPGWRELVLKSKNFGYFFMGIPSAIFLQYCNCNVLASRVITISNVTFSQAC